MNPSTQAIRADLVFALTLSDGHPDAVALVDSALEALALLVLALAVLSRQPDDVVPQTPQQLARVREVDFALAARWLAEIARLGS